jgi:tRNA pseudouridine38-40 synthase
MFIKKYFYLIKIQYLGYRFHGWQKQPKVKTLHLMIDRTFNYILEDKYFKTLAAGRTDAMVSANEAAFELFLHHKIEDEAEFLDLFNKNLPQDIRAISIEEVSENFNIINSSKTKEYIYLFTYGEKCHPFCASILTTILDDLDIELMKQGAKLFEGKHNFKAYCYRVSNEGLYNRTIDVCELQENNLYTASFFPEKTYVLRIVGRGFGRNQIRLMMGALIKLGRGEITLDYIKESLMPESKEVMDYIAPASGLILNKISFEE